MRVWTVQPLIVWESLQTTGTLVVDSALYSYSDYIPWQYEWLARQLQDRIPGYSGGLPWWAYCTKPDLRWVRHRRAMGTPQVRIELEVKDALAMPCWAWNEVYCGQFLSSTEREHDAWHLAMRQDVPDEDEWPLPEPWRSELETSWLRVFDSDLPKDGWTDVSKKRVCEEAVFEMLRLEDVCAMTRFVGSYL